MLKICPPPTKTTCTGDFSPLTGDIPKVLPLLPSAQFETKWHRSRSTAWHHHEALIWYVNVQANFTDNQFFQIFAIFNVGNFFVSRTICSVLHKRSAIQHNRWPKIKKFLQLPRLRGGGDCRDCSLWLRHCLVFPILVSDLFLIL